MPYIRYTTEDDNCELYKKHRYDAGWDLRSANNTFTLKEGTKVKVDTGVKMAIPRGYFGMILPRSGIGTKYEVALANTAGVIDSDYRGNIVVWLVNKGNVDVEIKKYDRICQIIILPCVLQSMRRVSFLDGTSRGEDGFGSSGAE